MAKFFIAGAVLMTQHFSRNVAWHALGDTGWQPAPGGVGRQEPDERCRALRRIAANPGRCAVANQYQLLPDGGLVRSERLARLEAALLIAGAAVNSRKLAQLARLIDGNEVRQLIQILNEAYDRDRTAFRIEQTAAGYIMMTRAALSPWLDRLHQRQAQLRLSPPMMETLTIIAYQQPVTRADVEAIRGVQSTEMIRQLIDRGLVRVGGEDDSLGRPFLYETTRQFLSMFGLHRLEDLPGHDTLRRHQAGNAALDPMRIAPEDDDADLDSSDDTVPDVAGDERTPAGPLVTPDRGRMDSRPDAA